MTRGEILAHNAGVAAVASLATAAADRLRVKLREKPTRFAFAIEALDAIVEASGALMIHADGPAPVADQPVISAPVALPAAAKAQTVLVTRTSEPLLDTTDVGGDPKDIAKAKGFTGDMCTSCGGLRMVRTGTCSTCQDCGGTSGGCS